MTMAVNGQVSQEERSLVSQLVNQYATNRYAELISPTQYINQIVQHLPCHVPDTSFETSVAYDIRVHFLITDKIIVNLTLQRYLLALNDINYYVTTEKDRQNKLFKEETARVALSPNYSQMLWGKVHTAVV